MLNKKSMDGKGRRGVDDWAIMNLHPCWFHKLVDYGRWLLSIEDLDRAHSRSLLYEFEPISEIDFHQDHKYLAWK